MTTVESGLHCGDVKFGKNNGRDNNNSCNRASVSCNNQDWKSGHSCETTESPSSNPQPPADFVNSWDQLQPKDKHDKISGTVIINMGGQRPEKENPVGPSIDWKSFKWVCSGSLSSRGSDFSHSSGSKSIGGDSLDVKVDIQPGSITPLRSPSGDVAPCVTSRAPAEETSSRKKPRLGWGEGLAKYEKKVDGPEETVDKEAVAGNGLGDFVSSGPLHPVPVNLDHKIPCATAYTECSSPTTRCTAACTSSPGVEAKVLMKGVTSNNDFGNHSASNHHLSQNQTEELGINLDNLDLTKVNLSSSLNELMQSDDSSAVGCGFTAMEKLQVWKAYVSKTLEVTESKIDSLENELRFLISDVRGSCPCPAVSSSLTAVCNGRNSKERQVPAGSSLSALPVDGDVFFHGEEQLYNLILASNRDLASKVSKEFSKLLPTTPWHNDISRTTSKSTIKGKFAMRKRFLKFKERVITLKFRVFRYLWKEDLRLLSVSRLHVKSQKKHELSPLAFCNGYHKNRSSIRSRFSFPAGNLSLVPTTEIINYTNRLLSGSQIRIYRDTLKMPALILDSRERMASRFASDNGSVEDPCAVEKERYVVNPWTSEEKETFLDKFALFGKDLRRIASSLEHKTVADCVEFYYKNHKSDRFQKTKKKEGKTYSTSTYLVTPTPGKRWHRDIDVASLNMLGAASAIASSVDGGTSSDHRDEGGILGRSSSLVLFGNERETAAADVLAGICGSMSIEALTRVDHREWKCSKKENRGEEMETGDWTDDEKSRFLRAVASYGKDFSMIARRVRTRSKEQCNVFFSKARKCLGLDTFRANGADGPAGQVFFGT